MSRHEGWGKELLDFYLNISLTKITAEARKIAEIVYPYVVLDMITHVAKSFVLDDDDDDDDDDDEDELAKDFSQQVIYLLGDNHDGQRY